MNFRLTIIITLISSLTLVAQDRLPDDYLSKEFHKERRAALRAVMPVNSMAVFFTNAVRNRSNDVDYVFHQDPNFYYLTGYKEPNGVLVIYSENQINAQGETFNEVLYVQERNLKYEQWTGYRLGIEGAKEKLGFKLANSGKDFIDSKIDYAKFNIILMNDFKNDLRDSSRNKADLYDLVETFKRKIDYVETDKITGKPVRKKLMQKGYEAYEIKKDFKILSKLMAELRQIKTKEELVLLSKAIRISAIGQIEVMKAMHTEMSESEIQGVHEYVYKKYNSEYEGFPSVIGSGNNSCILHYIENSKTVVQDELVLMDLGAEYHGYSGDVTRTIPANGTFSPEQKTIYDLVLRAQVAGIKASIVGNTTKDTDTASRAIITQGLIELGILKNEKETRKYFPHSTSHYLGLDVHDVNLKGPFKANMVITIEPGIYIPHGSECDKKWWGIGVRIEDDILISENGPINLSEEAPRTTDAIEALMKTSSALDAFKLPKLD
ncbi:Xaa-Pro aminopeptidase [Flavobacteriales bacterium 34_180_T64]|nr:Xaa-Pro aminopeptidase [Flavobacteriales bacterium 34_180_T64]